MFIFSLCVTILWSHKAVSNPVNLNFAIFVTKYFVCFQIRMTMPFDRRNSFKKVKSSSCLWSTAWDSCTIMSDQKTFQVGKYIFLHLLAFFVFVFVSDCCSSWMKVFLCTGCYCFLSCRIRKAKKHQATLNYSIFGNCKTIEPN